MPQAEVNTCSRHAGSVPINTQGSSSTYDILLLGFHINGYPHKTEHQQELEKKYIFQLYRLQWGTSHLRQQKYVIGTEQLYCNTVNRQRFLVVMTLVPAIRALQMCCSLYWMTWGKDTWHGGRIIYSDAGRLRIQFSVYETGPVNLPFLSIPYMPGWNIFQKLWTSNNSDPTPKKPAVLWKVSPFNFFFLDC